MEMKTQVNNKPEINPHSVKNPDRCEHGPPGNVYVVFQLHGDEDGCEEEGKDLERQLERRDTQPLCYLLQRQYSQHSRGGLVHCIISDYKNTAAKDEYSSKRTSILVL